AGPGVGLGLTATPAGSTAAVRLSRGTVVGGPPAVAVDGAGNVLAAWRQLHRAFQARYVRGRWAARELSDAVGEPAVAAGADGAAMLVARAGGRIDLARFPGPTAVIRPAGGRIRCCALLDGP